MTSSTFAVIYAPELAQYVVERGALRVVPTATLTAPDARLRATALRDALNRVYAPACAGAQVAEPDCVTDALTPSEDDTP